MQHIKKSIALVHTTGSTQLKGEVTSQVYSTYEYDQFHIPQDKQRELNNAHVNLLVRSMEDYGLIPQPILVDREGYVQDGQHRLAACKLLKLPVHYVIAEDSLGLHDVAGINSANRPWKDWDYLLHYKENNYNYEQLFLFMNAEGIPASKLPVAIQLADYRTPRGKDGRRFKAGKFVSRAARNIQTEYRILTTLDAMNKTKGMRRVFPQTDFFSKHGINITRDLNALLPGFSWTHLFRNARMDQRSFNMDVSTSRFLYDIEDSYLRRLDHDQTLSDIYRDNIERRNAGLKLKEITIRKNKLCIK